MERKMGEYGQHPDVVKLIFTMPLCISVGMGRSVI